MSNKDDIEDTERTDPPVLKNPVKKAEAPFNSRGLGSSSTQATVDERGSKYAQLESRYIQPANSSYTTCGTCLFFLRAPEGEVGDCRVVESPIHWTGTCDFFISAETEAAMVFAARDVAAMGPPSADVPGEDIHRSAEVDKADKKKKPVYAEDNGEAIEKKISEKDGKFCVTSEDGGRGFGCYGTREAAERRLAQVESFKHKEASSQEEWVEILFEKGAVFAEDDFAGGCPSCTYGDEDTITKTANCPYCFAKGGDEAQTGIVGILDKATAILVHEGEEVTITPPTEPALKEIYIELAAIDTAKQIVFGVVMEPESVDSQGDTIEDPEVIEKSAHNFMLSSRVIGKAHTKKAKADPVESFIAQEDMKIGKEKVRKGSWVMAVKVHDAALWKGVVGGEYTGFSIGAMAKRRDLEEDPDAIDT